MQATLRDRLFWLSLAAGPLSCLLLGLTPLGFRWGWPLADAWPLLLIVVVYPLLEELVFRGQLQPWLQSLKPARLGPLTLANLLTSLLFTALHFFFHPPLWAAAVLLPSLVFGAFRDRHDSVFPAVLLHMLYNLSYCLILG